MKSPEKQSALQNAAAVKSGVRINKKLACVLYIILGMVTVALLIMTVFASASGEEARYPAVSTIAFVLLGTAIAVSVVAFNPQKSFYDIGFYLLHTGIVIFLAGMMIFALKGSSHYVALPDLSDITRETENHMKTVYGWSDDDIDRLKSYRNQIAADSGEIIDLGFNFRITDFETLYYEDSEAVKHYEADVEFFLSNGTTEAKALTVNHPLYREGWKIYLMNVGVSPYGYEQINLLIKKDPAEFLSVAGIILIVCGTFAMCLFPEKSLNFCRGVKKRGVVTNV